MIQSQTAWKTNFVTVKEVTKQTVDQLFEKPGNKTEVLKLVYNQIDCQFDHFLKIGATRATFQLYRNARVAIEGVNMPQSDSLTTGKAISKKWLAIPPVPEP